MGEIHELNAFRRPSLDEFEAAVYQHIGGAMDRMKETCGDDVLIVGVAQIPARPVDDAHSYGVNFCYGENATLEDRLDAAANIVAMIAMNDSETEAEAWTLVQKISRRAVRAVKDLWEEDTK